MKKLTMWLVVLATILFVLVRLDDPMEPINHMLNMMGYKIDRHKVDDKQELRQEPAVYLEKDEDKMVQIVKDMKEQTVKGSKDVVDMLPPDKKTRKVDLREMSDETPNHRIVPMIKERYQSAEEKSGGLSRVIGSQVEQEIKNIETQEATNRSVTDKTVLEGVVDSSTRDRIIDQETKNKEAQEAVNKLVVDKTAPEVVDSPNKDRIDQEAKNKEVLQEAANTLLVDKMTQESDEWSV